MMYIAFKSSHCPHKNADYKQLNKVICVVLTTENKQIVK